jgi:hypothetical protein
MSVLDRYYNIWWLKPLFRLMGVIPMATQGKAMIESLDQAPHRPVGQGIRLYFSRRCPEP